MPWTNRQYPVNSYEARVPHRTLCEHCGREENMHGRLRAPGSEDEGTTPFSLCLEEHLPVLKQHLKDELAALAAASARKNYKFEKVQEGIYKLERLTSSIRMVQDNIKFQPARRMVTR